MRLLNFGKYAGQPINKVPLSYLRWLVREVNLEAGLYRDVEDEIRRRVKEYLEDTKAKNDGPRLVREAVEYWHREMLFRLSRENGGNSRLQRAQQQAYERLKAILGPATRS